MRDYDDYDGPDFADPGGRSALRAATKRNPRNLPCPNCGAKNRLTPADRALGYQCDRNKRPARGADAMSDDIHDAMLEMGEQADPVREALRRMLAEFGDQHYHTCPADNDSGPCDCFAGHLVIESMRRLKAEG